jgi:hypothetical protein
MKNILSPRWGLFIFHFPPRAYAVGCILSPLRGWLRRGFFFTLRLVGVGSFLQEIR